MRYGPPNKDEMTLFEKSALIFWKQAYECPDKPPQEIRKYISKLVRYIEQEGKCCFCERDTIAQLGEPYNRKRLATIEHVIPRSTGGANSFKNYLISCYECNNSRGCENFEVFAEKMRGVKRNDQLLISKYKKSPRNPK